MSSTNKKTLSTTDLIVYVSIAYILYLLVTDSKPKIPDKLKDKVNGFEFFNNHPTGYNKTESSYASVAPQTPLPAPLP